MDLRLEKGERAQHREKVCGTFASHTVAEPVLFLYLIESRLTGDIIVCRRHLSLQLSILTRKKAILLVDVVSDVVLPLAK